MSILEDISRIGKLLFERHLTYGAGGNISVREGDRVYITRSGASLAFIGDGDVVEVDMEGNVLSGERPSSELPLHLFLYRNLDVKAIVHAHPIFSISYFTGESRLHPVGTESRVVLKGFRVVEDDGVNITNFEGVLEALKACPVTFVRNHGSVAVGESLEEAFVLTDLLEGEVRVQCSKRSWVFSEGRFKVSVSLNLLGSDLLVVVGGSERPHIGGVSVTELVDDINRPGRKTRSTSSISLKGHKDEAVLRILSENLSKRFGKNVVAVGGVHWDNLSREEIDMVLDMFKRISEEITLP